MLFLLAGIGGQGVLAPWFGLLQRLFIVPFFLWIEIIAIRLYVLSTRPRPMEAVETGGSTTSRDAPQ